MRKVFYSGLAILVLGLLAVPAWAQKGGRGRGGAKAPGGTAMSRDKASTRSTTGHTSMSLERSNKGGEVRGLERAREVQGMSTKADTERGFTVAPGISKAETHASTQAGGTGQTSSQAETGKANKGKGKGKGNPSDPDESQE